VSVSKESINAVLSGILKSSERELFSKTKEELEGYWYFKFNHDLTIADNLYEFYNLLSLYKSFCRRWEEEKNGACCVVERVRDLYLMPKIKAFVKEITLEVGE